MSVTRPSGRGPHGNMATKVDKTHWESGDPRDDVDPAVVADLLPGGVIQLRLSELAATRLLLALGVGTAGHVQEVADVMSGISLLTTGVSPGAIRETRKSPPRSRLHRDLWSDLADLETRVADLADRVESLEAR